MIRRFSESAGIPPAPQPGSAGLQTGIRSRSERKRLNFRSGAAAVCAALCVALLGAPRLAPGQPDLDPVRDEIVIVRGFDSLGRALGDISGFAAGAGFVVTNARMLRAAENVVVVTGREAEEYPAEVIASDRRSDVAILRAEGFDAAGALFAADGPEAEPGDGLHLPRYTAAGALDDETVPGSISELRLLEPGGQGERAVLLVRHNAAATARQYGMPLLNDCGEVVGLIRTSPDVSETVLNSRPDPGGAPFGVVAAEIRRALSAAEAEPRVAAEPCLDPRAVAAAARAEAAEAQAQAEAAQEEAEAAQADAEAAQAEAAAARDETEQARAETEAAEQRAEESETEREAAEAAREEAQAEAAAAAEREAALDATRRYLWVVIVLGIAAAAAVVFLLVRRLRRRREQLATTKKELETERETAIQPAAYSCLLEGDDESGRAHAVKISAEQLGSPSGVVVGRNPAQAGVLLDHPEASREHFRVMAREGGIVIEDLHSTNGTYVNGARVEPGAAAEAPDGAVIGVGTGISLTVKIHRPRK